MLRDLSLNQNNIYKLDFDPSAVKNTQKLSLAHNNIKDITPLAELPLLRVVDLSGNKIEAIDDILGLKYIERLDLSMC
jgi:Leucine-rich repeat (LRR) protein